MTDCADCPPDTYPTDTTRCEPCPRCGSPLLHDGTNFWCSFFGGPQEKSCAFGIDAPVGKLALGVMLARGAEHAPAPFRGFA